MASTAIEHVVSFATIKQVITCARAQEVITVIAINLNVFIVNIAIGEVNNIIPCASIYALYTTQAITGRVAMARRVEICN